MRGTRLSLRTPYTAKSHYTTTGAQKPLHGSLREATSFVGCSSVWLRGISCSTQYKGKLNIHLNLTSGGRVVTPIPACFEHGQGRDVTDELANETLED